MKKQEKEKKKKKNKKVEKEEEEQEEAEKKRKRKKRKKKQIISERTYSKEQTFSENGGVRFLIVHSVKAASPPIKHVLIYTLDLL